MINNLGWVRTLKKIIFKFVLFYRKIYIYLCMKKVKIREYAKEHSVTYRTVWNWVKKGLVKYEQLPSGTILIILD